MAVTAGASFDHSFVSQRWQGIQVEHLILASADFIVWIDPDLDIDWQTSPKYDEAGPRDLEEWNAVLNRVATLESIPNDQHGRSVRLNFKRMIGEGVARGLDHDYESAKNILQQANSYIVDRNVEIARYWQLSTACVLAFLSLLAGITSWALRDPLIRELGDPAFGLLLAGLAGSLGAVLSMIFRMGDSYPTSEAPRPLHLLEAISRGIAGFLSGILIAGAIKIGLILPALVRSGDTLAVTLVTAMASGTSERWAPSLIAKLEGSSSKHQSKKGDKR